jgi:hypothetical protein
MAKMKPTELKPEFLRACFDVLCADPPVLRWRERPREHFATERDWRMRNKSLAGQTLRPQADGRIRVTLVLASGGARTTFDARAVVAEIGVTRVGDRWGIPDAAPNDRFADTRALAGSGPLAAVMQAARQETRRSLDELSVMEESTDPYRLDTAARRAAAQWFADRVAQFIAPDRRIHIRGVFYACVSHAALNFANTAANADWLGEAAR